MGQYLDKVLALAQANLGAEGPTREETYENAPRRNDPEEVERGEDWDEADWDDVRSHLETDPWSKKVLGGENPGEPPSEGWRERGRELERGELSNTLLLTPRTAEASTVPEPTVPPGGPGLFHMKGHQLPPYVQHLYKHLVGRYGKHRAYGVAIGIVKKWAAGVHPGGKHGKKGGHRVHADVQAAAAKNVAQWEKEKAEAHARHHGKEGKSGHVKASGPDFGLALVLELAAAGDQEEEVHLARTRDYTRSTGGRLEHVHGYLRPAEGRPATFATPEEFHANYLPERQAKLDKLKADADKAGVAAMRVLGSTGWASAERAALAAQKKYQEAVKDAVEVARRRNPIPDADVSLAAPAAWPSGKPYKQSLLPPGPTTNALAQGSPLRTGVITNAPGTKPVGVGQLRQTPSQTAAASPPLPPDVGLPSPDDLTKLAGTVQDGADPSMAEGIRKHLRDAAHKLSVDDPIQALQSLRSAQTATHSAYRSAVAANAPNVATVYGSVFKIPPAEQSSATDQMMAGREITDHYRALHHQIATHIDRFRRTWFHGQYQHMPEARFSANIPALLEPVGGYGPSRLVSKFDALPIARRPQGGMGRVHEYTRKEHGRLQEVQSYDRIAEDIRGTARSIPDVADDPRPEQVRSYLHAAARALSSNDHEAALNHLISAHTFAGGGQFSHENRPLATSSDIPVSDRIRAHLSAVRSSAGGALYKFSAGLDRVLALTEVHPYEREAFGRIVHVRNYVRAGSTEPYSGTLMGHEADEAIGRGEAIGEYGEPTGFFKTSAGQRMWGWYGAAGLLVRHTDENGVKRYLLQKRSPYVEEGNTWSTPGGAIEHVNGVAEEPEAAARREAREEFGSDLPEGTKVAEIRSKTFGEGPGAWSYHTVVMDAPHQFNPEGENASTAWESRGYRWATPGEMADMPLHPHFRATAEELGMPEGGGQHPPTAELAAGA